MIVSMKKVTLVVCALALISGALYFYHISYSPTEFEKSQPTPAFEDTAVKKPESFKSVEMTTYRSEFGYEIAFPKMWKQKDYTSAYYQPAFEVVSIIPKDIDDPYFHDALVTIIVQARTLEDFQITKDVVVGDWSQFEPTVLNGIPAFKKKLREPGAYYIFEHNGMLFGVDFQYDPLMDISEEEALWVLSTFRIDN